MRAQNPPGDFRGECGIARERRAHGLDESAGDVTQGLAAADRKVIVRLIARLDSG
jgi:hypothetical protein